MILNYPDEPNVVKRDLLRERGRQESQSLRRFDKENTSEKERNLRVLCLEDGGRRKKPGM